MKYRIYLYPPTSYSFAHWDVLKKSETKPRNYEFLLCFRDNIQTILCYTKRPGIDNSDRIKMPRNALSKSINSLFEGNETITKDHLSVLIDVTIYMKKRFNISTRINKISFCYETVTDCIDMQSDEKYKKYLMRLNGDL